MVIVPVLLMPWIGVLVSTHAPQVFMVQTSLLIQEGAQINPTLAKMAVETGYKRRIAALSRLLHSRYVLNNVAVELNLINDKMSQGEKDWIIRDIADHLILELKGVEDADYDEMVQGTRKKVDKWQGEGLLFIRYTSKKTEHMVELVDSVRKHFLSYLLAPTTLSLEDSEQFLEGELGKLRAALKKSETALAEFKTANAQLLPVLRGDYGNMKAEFEERMRARRALLEAARSDLANYQHMLIDRNPLVRALDDRIEKANNELDELESRYTDSHSKVLETKQRIARLTSEREHVAAATRNLGENGLEQMWQLAKGTSQALKDETLIPGIARQLQQIQDIQLKVVTYENEVEAVKNILDDIQRKQKLQGGKEQELQKLERDIAAKNELYTALAERLDNAKISQEVTNHQQAEMVQVIDPPRDPERTSPAKYWYFITGIIGGIALGAGLAIATESVDKSFRRTSGLQAALKIPVISRMPVLDEAGVKPAEI